MGFTPQVGFFYFQVGLQFPGLLTNPFLSHVYSLLAHVSHAYHILLQPRMTYALERGGNVWAPADQPRGITCKASALPSAFGAYAGPHDLDFDASDG